MYTKWVGLLDGGEVSLLVGGREDIGCGWRAVEGSSRDVAGTNNTTSPSCSLSKNVKMNTQNKKQKALFGVGVKLGI